VFGLIQGGRRYQDGEMALVRPELRLVATAQEISDAADARVAQADAELLALVRTGNPASAAVFHDRVRPQVDRTLSRLLGAHDNDYADLAQIALIELVTTIGRYRGECALDTWVSTVTAHAVYKHLRRRQAERRLFEPLPLENDLPNSRGQASVRQTARDVLQRVSGHLSMIDLGQSWAFVLHDVFGYDVREVAQILSISVAAAQSRLVRGRKHLHERIAADPELAPMLLRMETNT
jgi:RNA polymerase sigma factor (sigma-70 family)